MKRETRGRPPLGDEAASAHLQIRVTPEDKARIAAAARSRGVGISEYIRRLATRDADRLARIKS